MMDVLDAFEGMDWDGNSLRRGLSFQKTLYSSEEHGADALVKPKSNTTGNAKESWVWKEMVTMYKEDRIGLDDRYHKRSIVEAVYAAFKAMFRNSAH